ncbi:Rhomboid family protein [uncultured Paludibacter sp.]|nr:Rhomboid family protein [uncultured Paludibacter sp.]
MILAFLFEKGMGWDFTVYGLEPRVIKSFLHLFFIPFIHANVGHLVNNIIAFFVLSVSLYYFYSSLANKILVLSVIFSGVFLWIIGRESYHIGASGVVFALSFFLFFSGIIRKHVPLIAISLIVVFLYGNNVWHLFPWSQNDPVSWEGHLAGGITGTLLAVFFRKEGPQKPEKNWEDDDLLDEEIEYPTEEKQNLN